MLSNEILKSSLKKELKIFMIHFEASEAILILELFVIHSGVQFHSFFMNTSTSSKNVPRINKETTFPLEIGEMVIVNLNWFGKNSSDFNVAPMLT